MADYLGPEYLSHKLNTKRSRVLTRYQYYEMKNIVRDLNISTPPSLRNLNAVLGWCGKAVDSVADRLIFREFRNDYFDLNGIFQMNNPDMLFNSAILGALISSCDFIYIRPDEEGFPKMEVIDGGNATGVLDSTTGLLTEGYAILKRDKYKQPLIQAYFTPNWISIYERGVKIQEVHHNVMHPLLVPIIYKPDAVRPFGHSRISRACMSHLQSAARTIKRSEISAEFYSIPQKYVVGLDEDAELDKWSAAMSALLTITKGEEGSDPKVGQFAQQSMSPHIDQLRMFAGLFAGETGLTLDDLGFPSDNPSSQEAIKASHESLRLTARRAMTSFGSGFLNAGYLAACLRDNYSYKRGQLYMTKPIFEPIFEPDAATLSSIGDGAIKINQAVPGYFAKENLRDLTGIDPAGE